MKKILFSSMAVLAGISASAQAVFESAREIPLAGEYDVVVAGGTAAGVAAAVSAHEAGAKVFLAGGRPYLGEDLAGTLELDNDGIMPQCALTKALWSSFTDLAPYAFVYDAAIAHGPYAYHNDAEDRVGDSVWPMTPAEATVFNTDVTYDCTLDKPSHVKRVEVVVVETPDDWLDVSKRPAKGMDSLLAKVSDVTLVLSGRQGGCTGIPLLRTASKLSGGVHYRQRANLVTFAADVDADIASARVRFSLAKGAKEICVSRIWFRLAAGETRLRMPTPLKAKQTLDRELVSRKIPFLTGSPVTDILHDKDGKIAGVVVANRSGRQAFRAKCVIDATRYGTLSRLGGGLGLGGDADFTRVIVKSDGKLTRIPLTLPMGNGGFRFLAAAEEVAREKTWDASMRDDADELVLKTPLQPISRRDGLLSINSQQTLEERIAAAVAAGSNAASLARTRPAPVDVVVEQYNAPGLRTADAAGEEGDVRELLGGLRPYLKKSLGEAVASPARALPVLAECDVLVCGGGTSGAAAALGAAKGGAKTIVAEWLGVLGGIGTDGMIVSYCAGNNRGFTRRFCRLEYQLGAVHTYASARNESARDPDSANRAETMYYHRAEAWRRSCRDAGVKVWYGTFVEGAYVRGDKVLGAVVVTPFGRGVVRAKSVIDATGNADVAAAAGAATEFIPKGELQLQSAGQAPHRMRGAIVNSDFGFVNDADAWDLWLFGVRARAGAPDAWDLQKLPDSRERRHIVPDYAVCGEDVVAHRRFPDTVLQAYAPQDAHGPLMEDYCYLSAASSNVVRRGTHSEFSLNVPLRSLLPRGLSNIAVVGTGAGCARDVMPMVRMQGDLMNMGYAVGLGAASAPDGDFRRLDMKTFRARLCEEDILEPAAREWDAEEDFTSDAVVAAAVATMSDAFRGSDVVFRRENRAKALPLLRKAWVDAKTFEAKVIYAETLGFMGDGTGAETLSEAVRRGGDWESIHPQGRYGDRVSDGTGHLIALGRTKAAAAYMPIAEKLAALNEDSEREAVRGVMLAAAALGDRRLAAGLTAFLGKPGVSGHAVASPDALGPQGGYGPDFEMSLCMRELSVARALVACGDSDGIGRKTLEAYAVDPRGVLSEYASAVLAACPLSTDAQDECSLPGESCTNAPIVNPVFPDRMSEYVWRNWFCVDKRRLAQTVDATPEELAEIATQMGLPPDPVVEPEWPKRGYVTVLRRNWHILPYGQLMTLVGWNREMFRDHLNEDDYLFQKMGNLKPKCEVLKWRSGEVEKWRAERMRIAAILKEEGIDAAAGCEPRFAFIRELSAMPTSVGMNLCGESPFRTRLQFSYFADYADPLLDDDVRSFPEGLLARYAQEGVNAVWLHVVLRTLAKDPYFTEFGEGCERRQANLRKLVARAAKHGIKVFLYLNEPRPMPCAFFEDPKNAPCRGTLEWRGTMNAMCIESPEVRRWMTDAMEQVFRSAPGLGGAFIIGASENLVHCQAHGPKYVYENDKSGWCKPDKFCARCEKLPFARLVAEDAALLIEGMHRADPTARAFVWDWGWGYHANGGDMAVVGDVLPMLPKDNVSFMTMSERMMPLSIDGVDCFVNEYSLSQVGPSEAAKVKWAMAKQNGLGCIAKVQVSSSWEMAIVPYVPVMDNVARHAFNLVRAGVDGVMLSWSCGCYPSPNLAIFNGVRASDKSHRDVLERISKELYGDRAAPLALQVWTTLSQAFSRYPFNSPTLHCAPHHWGPANPLYLTKTGYAATMVGMPYDDLESWRSIFPAETYVSRCRHVADGFDEGARQWESVIAACEGEPKKLAEREHGIIRTVGLHMASCADQSLFIHARGRNDWATMREIAGRELARAKELLPIVERDSRIGYECSCHYFYIPQDLREKILNCRLVMEACERKCRK